MKIEKNGQTIIVCDSCHQAGVETIATGHSDNPEWAGYDLCDECIAEYNSRPPVNSSPTYCYAVEWPHGVCIDGATGKPWNSVYRFTSAADRTAWVDAWGPFGPKRRDENGYREATTRREVETRIQKIERYFEHTPSGTWMDTDGPEMLNE